MELKIYEKKKVIKTYTASEYDLPFGIVEDVTGLIDLESIKELNETEILKAVGAAVVKGMDSVKELLHDMFPEITDEEIRKTTVKDIAILLIDVLNYTISLLKRGFDEKNRMSR